MGPSELEVKEVLDRYFDALVRGDRKTFESLVSERTTFTHMSGKVQTRDEYISDVCSKRLQYFHIDYKDLKIEVDKDSASISCMTILDANAYGAKGVYHMRGHFKLKKVNGNWMFI